MRTNLTLLTDFYEITMANGYFERGIGDKTAYFDLYFRNIPDGGGYAIMAGVEQVTRYLRDLRFTKSDIDFLRSKNCFSERFLRYLENFKFVCDVWAIAEGTPIFPNEPLLIVRGPVIQAQFIETMLLLTINHQSLIATKANRIVRAAQGRAVMEFGSRRAQGYDGAFYGARAAYIGGCAGTSCTVAEKAFGIPAIGTMAHSWVQLFPDEYSAFRAYASLYPDNCTLLADTYNVLKSGVPNAIRTHHDVLLPLGKRLKGIRIDSGDITYLSKRARQMLDAAGLGDCAITASNSLDEYIIRETIMQGARIDAFGVGERLITSRSEPVFGGVYKLAAVENDGEIVPKIKLSENVSKITTPGFKNLFRLFSAKDGSALADVITLHDEKFDSAKPYRIFHPEYTWNKSVLTDFTAVPLLRRLFDKGRCVYRLPTVQEIQRYCKEQMDCLWDEVKRFENPHAYYVDLSKDLWELKQKLLDNYT
ncbi:MAG: nicotinate phosphoribosyltransferase [Clostridiales bacterium]|jgi:nicotinate phosphoribosyltransferase|nr:nicotinate phosphoribosyltransferase [Clostridiales bacterium]